MKDKFILIGFHGHFEEDFLCSIKEDIRKEFNYPIRCTEIHEDIHSYFDPARRQYDANKLLKFLENLHSLNDVKTIGIFQVDLFIPILTYIFGQAIYNGNTGIVSTFRLRNEQYGLERDDSLLMDRLRKIVIHELGHSFGLIHCHMPTCVMLSSTYVEDIDQKNKAFCSHCRAKLSSKHN
ncbi:archaemetzincin family Zn-dependent metalloprotease [Bacteroidota bacterium]